MVGGGAIDGSGRYLVTKDIIIKLRKVGLRKVRECPQSSLSTAFLKSRRNKGINVHTRSNLHLIERIWLDAVEIEGSGIQLLKKHGGYDTAINLGPD